MSGQTLDIRELEHHDRGRQCPGGCKVPALDLRSKEIMVANFSWRKAALVTAVAPMLALSACSSGGGRTPETGTGGGGGQVATTERMKIALIAHAPAGDTFWDTVRKGAEEAAAKD